MNFMLMILSKHWEIAPQASPEYLGRYRGIHPVIAQVLHNRGFEDPRKAYEFLYVKQPHRFLHDPFDMTDMGKAIGRIRSAIRAEEPIVVYGDFDADGVTATTLLVQALRLLGARVQPYIPHRVDEGYGLNSPALQEIAKRGVKLVITVDCGIRSVPEIEAGKAAGLDIIVTDHHSLGPVLPDAYAVVNPKRGKYPEPMLAGVGVAFKVVQALLKAERNNRPRHRNGNGAWAFEIETLADLVAIGTVADLMPLNHVENRVLVRRGLEVLQRASRPGVRALLEVAGVNPGDINTQTIGFTIGPRINAAGRLDDAILAYNLLASPNMTEAQKWAERLQELNVRRQDITRGTQERIRVKIEEEGSDTAPLIFAADTSFEPGIVGLVAGRLTEEYYKPSIVMEIGETESRASCRSIDGFNITEQLDKCADLLVRHGGHELAAGFTVANENIDALREKLMGLAEAKLGGLELKPELKVDVELDVHQLTEDLVQEINLLEPCGHGNDLPVFMSRNIHVAEARTVGKDDRHLKLKVSRAGRPSLDCIGFRLGEWARDMPPRIDMAYALEINEWHGRYNLQARLHDIRPAEDV